MPNMMEWVQGDAIRACIIAKAKVGKTWGAATWPRPNFIDFDGGLASVGQPAWRKRYGNRSIEYQTFVEKTKNNLGVVTQHNAFDDACRYFDEWMKPGKRDQFDTWVVDSVTALTIAALNKSIILLGTKALSVTSTTLEKAIKTGAIYPVLQDWGAERSLVEQFMRMVKDSGKHALLLCHEGEQRDKEGTLIALEPLMTGKSKEIIPAMFDELWYLRVERKGPDVVRYLQTQPDGLRKCGTRIGVPDGTPYEYDAVVKSLSQGK